MKNIGLGFLSRKLGLAWFGLYALTKLLPEAWAAALSIGLIVSTFLIVQGILDARKIDAGQAGGVPNEGTKDNAVPPLHTAN